MLSVTMRAVAKKERHKVMARIQADQETLAKLDDFLGLSNGAGSPQAKIRRVYKKKRKGVKISLAERVDRLGGMSKMALLILFGFDWMNAKSVSDYMVLSKNDWDDTKDMTEEWVRNQASATIGNMVRAGYLQKNTKRSPVEYALTDFGKQACKIIASSKKK